MSKKPAETLQEKGRTPKGQFAKGHVQNPKGRIPGSRNRATVAAQAVLDGEVENLTRKAVELALEGDVVALRLCLERILPAKKESPLPPVELPAVATAQDLPRLTQAVLEAVANGHITPGEGEKLAGLAVAHGKVLELQELERRIATLEENHAKD